MVEMPHGIDFSFLFRVVVRQQLLTHDTHCQVRQTKYS